MSPRRLPPLEREPLPAEASAAGGEVVRLPVSNADAALVAAVRGGDAGAVAELFARHGEQVRRTLARVLGPDPELGDLTQDAFLAALESLDRLEDPRRLRPFLASIAIFTARARIRSRKRWRRLLFFVSEPPDPPAAPHSDEASEALRATYRVLEALDVDDRIAFALRYVDGLELTDVAEAIGVSLATAKRRLSRAGEAFASRARTEPSLSRWLEEGGRWPTS